ncbi:hypothetical protein [Niallia endozanthoxylica]|uniref:Uncharacterized protein n=1 Tax=Niallia endozanthoxylica TaxID=2036016 RepID=A0A5J5HP82_9BACI|nr:hypothetical protein [Niallia endozanthoxylica]KAA9021638.1 hypothetical protein F4V44_16755 [Niallia endozanthoxylica]
MILVCKNHVTDGLKETSAPHIEKVPTENKNCCTYCTEKAIYRLFYFGQISAKENSKVAQ